MRATDHHHTPAHRDPGSSGPTTRRTARTRAAFVTALLATTLAAPITGPFTGAVPTAHATTVTDGTADTTFATLTNGLWRTGLSTPAATDDQAAGMAPGPDDTTIIGVTCNGAWCVARLDPTGTLDTTFGTNGTGIAVLDPTGFFDGIHSLTTDPTGRILVSGYCGNGYVDMCVGRFTASGAVDTGFGTSGNGIARMHVTPNSDTAFGLTLDRHGNIVIAGTCYPSAVTAMCVARFTPDGAVDTSFSDDGVYASRHPDNANANANGAAVVVTPDDHVIVAGSCIDQSGADTTPNVCLTRFQSDGTLDTGFDGDGWKIIDSRPTTSSGNDSVHHMVLLPDGDVLATFNCDNQLCIVRVQADGTLDPAFGTDGMAVIALGNFPTSSRLVTDALDRITVVGTCNSTSICSTRLLADGTVDPTYGTSGNGTTITSTQYQVTVKGAALDTSGRLLASGTCTGMNYDLMYFMPRYEHQPCAARYLVEAVAAPVVVLPPPPPPPSTTTTAPATTEPATTEPEADGDTTSDGDGVDPDAPAGDETAPTPTGTPTAEQIAAFTPGTVLEQAPGSVLPGQRIVLTGAGFTPGERVDVYLASTPQLLGTTTADATGTVSMEVSIPADAPAGAHTLALYAPVSGTAVRQAVQIGVATLPATGTGLDAAGMSLALFVAALGSLAVLLSRRRTA